MVIKESGLKTMYRPKHSIHALVGLALALFVYIDSSLF